MTAFELSIFLTPCIFKFVLDAQIAYSQGILPELLLLASDILFTQCWHTEHLHKEVLMHMGKYLTKRRLFDLALLFFHYLHLYMS